MLRYGFSTLWNKALKFKSSAVVGNIRQALATSVWLTHPNPRSRAWPHHNLPSAGRNHTKGRPAQPHPYSHLSEESLRRICWQAPLNMLKCIFFPPFLLIGRGREGEKIYTSAIHSFPYICCTRHHHLNTMGTLQTPLSSEIQDPALKYRIWREQLSLFVLLANNFQSCSPKPLNHFKWTFQNKKKKNKIKTKIEENGILHSRHQLKQSTATYKPLKIQASDRKALALSGFLTAPPVVHVL